jgi:hypothetical protein
LGGLHGAKCRKLRGIQLLPANLPVCLGDFFVDALVFEFMGLAIIGLCVVVLMVPCARRPSERRVRDV